jgi:hypothetical protein
VGSSTTRTPQASTTSNRDSFIFSIIIIIIIIVLVLFPTDTRGLKRIYMEVRYWALLFMPLVILQHLYSLQIKGE